MEKKEININEIIESAVQAFAADFRTAISNGDIDTARKCSTGIEAANLLRRQLM